MDIDFDTVRNNWSNGAIITCDMLDANLLTVMDLNYQAAEEFRKEAQCPIPALNAALDSYKTRDRKNLPTSLIMAQRNVFGNHPIENKVNRSPGL